MFSYAFSGDPLSQGLTHSRALRINKIVLRYETEPLEAKFKKLELSLDIILEML
jgi:hypothetical protein